MSDLKQAADDIAGTIGAAVGECGEAIESLAQAMRTTEGRLGSLTMGDTMESVADRMILIRDAICRPGVPWDDGDGGKVGDLTDATIYAGRGLHAIASALDRIADSISEIRDN